MPVEIPEDALLNEADSADLKKLVALRLQYGKQYWWPLHARMDYWSSLYYMLDLIQQMKPVGYRRFISNSPHTAIDDAVSIMTRNDSFWRSDMTTHETDSAESLRTIGKVERMLQSIFYDADELMALRGLPPVWKQVAFSALLRGAIWGKFHITETALEYRSSPLMPEIFDPRLVTPHYDQYGLNYVNIEKHTTLGDLASVYPEKFEAKLLEKDMNPNRPAVKIEYWSNTRGEREGVTGVLAILSDPQTMLAPLTQPIVNADSIATSGEWVIPPHRHGYAPEELPVVGVFVNGDALQVKPSYSQGVDQAFQTRNNLIGHDMRLWQGPNSAVAERGKSILAAVEEQVPQFNELVATIFQHFSISAFGQWVFKTQTGELPNADLGVEARIPLRPEESIERLDVAPISVDAYRLLDLLRTEADQGTIAAVLRANAPGSSGESGILHQQVLNSALNGIEPFQSGMQQFGALAGTSLTAQMQRIGPGLKKFTISVPLRPNTFFRVDEDFDAAADLETGRKYRVRPVFKPALPDDMAIRINTARIAIDPSRPVLSLLTVLEKIIQVEDPQAEMDRMWNDAAERDPVIVLEQIAQALDRVEGEGNPLSERIREAQFRTRFAEDLQFRQIEQAAGGGQGGGGGRPELQPGSSGASESTQSQSDLTGGEPSAAEGASVLSNIG